MNNRVSPLFPESFFFTDEPQNLGLSVPLKYGPLSGNETTQYRTTTAWNVSGITKAYAICQGQVFLQPSTQDSTKVNLILRPYRQPIRSLPIKYFIYRGLNKSDFISGASDNLIGYSDLGGASAFMNLIWNQLKDFNDWDDATASTNNFKAKWIGFDPDNQSDNDKIDDYFFNTGSIDDTTGEETKVYELPIVAGGTHLGSFSGTFGLDMVLSDGDYRSEQSNTGFEYNLAFAKAHENIINTEALPPNTAEKQYREAILDFIDPAAFYGLHVPEGGKVFVPQAGTTPILKEELSIYTNLIDPCFVTRNRVYICIQGHLGRSYDYYNSYSNLLSTEQVIQYGITNESLTQASFGTHNWPVLIVDEEQSHEDTINKIHLKLLYQVDVEPVVYTLLGQPQENAENNFLAGDQLIDTNLDTPSNIAFTQVFYLQIPAFPDGEDRPNVSSLVKLLYQGTTLTVNQDVDGNTVERPVKPIDTLFGPLDIASPISSNSDEIIAWGYHNVTRLITKKQNFSQTSVKNAIQMKMVFDKYAYLDNGQDTLEEHMIFESELISSVGNNLNSRNISINTSGNAGNRPFDVNANNFYEIGYPFEITKKGFSDQGQSITGMQFSRINNAQTSKFVLAIADDEMSSLKSLVDIEAKSISSIFFENYYPQEEYDRGEIIYKRFKLSLIQENNDGELILVTPGTSIIIYTLDDFIYFSNAHTRHRLMDQPIDEVIVDFNL